jgi:hypothetical protein
LILVSNSDSRANLKIILWQKIPLIELLDFLGLESRIFGKDVHGDADRPELERFLPPVFVVDLLFADSSLLAAKPRPAAVEAAFGASHGV